MTPNARYGRRADLELVATGEWTKTARKTYRHQSGIVVRYLDNDWSWEILGGAQDGNCYGTLTVAAHFAIEHLKETK